ncbi:MAG: hypothetical protein I8H87_11835 [Comamonadaceae bacterium]|nr:hypothetical protein [Comamonadaceae bacterium]
MTIPPPAPPGPSLSSIDTTKRQAPGPDSTGPVQTAPSGAKPNDTPKLSHERDESVDVTHGEPDAQMQQAYRDVKRGLQDTDQYLRAHRVGHKPVRL